MSVEIRVPSLGESVTEATVAKWFKQIGEAVTADEPLVELETDKVTLEYNAPASGTLTEILVEQGGEVEVGALLGSIDESASGSKIKAARPAPETSPTSPTRAEPLAEADAKKADASNASTNMSPAVRKLVAEHDLDLSQVTPTGPKGNVTKGDVLVAMNQQDRSVQSSEQTAGPSGRVVSIDEKTRPQATGATTDVVPTPSRAAAASTTAQITPIPEIKQGEERIKMTRLRRRIAERLKEAQNTAAILTTYNEVDMGNVMALRKRYRDAFTKKHDVRLGFMSFFVKATINALHEIPALNAEVDGDEIVYKHHYHIGVAVGTPNGLVVPVVRDADRLSFAETEKTINGLGLKARDGKLAMEDLVGGTFTISNGGVYGSLMSSPILNPPQVGILGMHKIEERPVAIDGLRQDLVHYQNPCL